MLPIFIQELISKLPAGIGQRLQPILAALLELLAKKDARIKELEDQIAKNSGNSSKPPSTDGLNKPKPKSPNSGKSKDRKAGGQPKHKGTTLEMTAHPDHIVAHPVDSCKNCQGDLSAQASESIIRHQVVDVPMVKMEFTEHQAEVKTCTCGCVNTGEFPAHASRYIQYGPTIKGLTVYLQDYQLLPYERTAQLISDLYGHRLSTGSLYNFSKKAYEQLEDFEERLKKLLCGILVAGFDETGFRVNKVRMWLHSCSTALHAYYTVHNKRGYEAMQAAEILPHFKGTAVHDFWKPYLKYDCEHSLCNAHMLRELQFISERFQQSWADDMASLLCKMKTAKKKAISKGKTALSARTIRKYQKQYDKIIQQGLDANPFEPPKEKKRGPNKKTKPRNLLERLRDYRKEYLRFFTDFYIPFDNNFSERDIRMMKVKQKVSGCFRSLNGAQHFARIRSYIVTTRKQKLDVFQAICNLFKDNTFYEKLIAC